MAIAVPPEVVLIHQWPIFEVRDTTGFPLIGGQLFSYEANTTTPKSTWADPYGLTPNPNPVILDADGRAIVWLDGFYALTLTDRHGEVLWTVQMYEYPAVQTPPVDGMVSGYTDVVVTATPGGVLQAPNAVPLGYRVKAVLVRIDTAFGTSGGLSGIMVGDATLCDGWGVIGITAGLQTGQQQMARGDQPIAATSYTVLLAATGGNFDAVGACTVRAFWESVTGWT